MPVLLCAQHIARAADFKIAHGDFEARAELRIFADRLQPLCGNLREHLAARIGEIGICAAARAPDASADLMQLRKPHAVCIFDHERVGIWNIHAGFDNCCANKHIHLAVDHRLPDALHLLAVRFAVRRGNARLRHGFANPCGAKVDILHAVVQPKNLPAAAQLRAHRLRQKLRIIFRHIALHGHAVARGLLQNAHIADTRHGHMQRAGNRGRRQCQNVNAARHGFQFFLLRNAEALLLIHNHKPEIVKHHIAAEHAVGADENIDLAPLHRAQRFLLLCRRAKARKHIHLHGKPAHAGADGLKMLHGKNRRGAQNGDLLAGKHRFKCRPQRHFRFSVADIAAQKPLHGHRALHILLDLLRRLQLPHSFLIGEGLLKIALHVIVLLKGKARKAPPCRIQGNQLLCHFLCRCADAAFCFCPFRAAHFGKANGAVVRMRADIFCDKIQLVTRNIQRVSPLIADGDKIARGSVNIRNGAQPLVFPDAVHLMHHIIAYTQIVVGGNALRRRFFAARCTFFHACTILPVPLRCGAARHGEQRDFFTRQHKARAGDAADQIGHPRCHFFRRKILRSVRRRNFLLRQNLAQRSRLCAALAKQSNAVSPAAILRDIRAQKRRRIQIGEALLRLKMKYPAKA